MRATMDRYWEATMAHDLERVHEFYHDDVVVEFPQSGERIRGKHNIQNSGHITPLKLLLKFCEFVEKKIWITELAIAYNDGRPINTVGIMEFRDGKIAYETHYYADSFEPPEWRSQWVERIK